MQTAMMVVYDEVMSRNMRLFAKELTVGASANECFGICQSSQPVETRAKRLVCEKQCGSRTRLHESLGVFLCLTPC
jgi:hypothetical protein